MGQEGLFTTRQAADAGYSPQLLLKYLRNGRIVRVRRGIYRIVHFPAAEHEDLVMLWLWSEGEGVCSHETALLLHELSDVLPRRVHLILPLAWAKRRFRVPRGVILHHADVAEDERMAIGAVPVTNVRRTLLDCIDVQVSPELIQAALRQARTRGLIDKGDIKEMRERGRAA